MEERFTIEINEHNQRRIIDPFGSESRWFNPGEIAYTRWCNKIYIGVPYSTWFDMDTDVVYELLKEETICQ